MSQVLLSSDNSLILGAGGPWIVDSNTVVMISLIAFLFIVYRLGWPLIRDMLDGQINQVKSELDEAKKLRADAEDLLKEYSAKHDKALSEAQEIVEAAKRDAEALKEKAELDLKASLKRREDAAKARIRQAESAAIANAQAAAASQAISAAEKILAERLDEKADSALIDDAIGLISGRLQ